MLQCAKTYSPVVPSSLFPDCAAVHWTTTDLTGDLHAAEQETIRSAVPTRVAEFRTGRTLARQCLTEFLGPAASEVVIERRPDRSPGWPSGFCGSLTHCAGLRICVVARTEDIAALGVDAESARPLPPEVVPDLLTPDECDLLAAHGLPDVVGFSAKESLFKLWSGLGGGWLDFHEAAITRVSDHDLALTLLVDARPHPMPETVTVGYRMRRTHVVTGAWLKATDSATSTFSARGRL